MGRKDLKVGNRLQRKSLEFRKYPFAKKASTECCVESKQWFIEKNEPDPTGQKITLSGC